MTEWDDAEKRVERAHELYERGQWQEALDELKAAIAINPYNGSWHFNLGLTYDALERTDDAISAYRQALEMDPEDLEVLCAVGIDSNRAGQFDDAIRFFERIEAIDASYEPSYCNRIVSYCEKGNHEKAEEMFYLARQYREKCPVCYYNMGLSQFARGNFDRALWCWQQVLAIDPVHHQVHARVADAYWAKGQLNEGAGAFYRGSAVRARRYRCDAGPGRIARRIGRNGRRRPKNSGRCLSFHPTNPMRLYHLGVVALMEEKQPAALEFFKRVIKAERTFPGAHLRMAQIYLKQNQPSEAAFHANCELAQQTNDEHTLLELGTVFLDLEQLGPAENTFLRVLEANPQNAAARHNLGVTLLKAGRVDEGIEQERRALALLPKYMLAMHNLSMAYLLKHDSGAGEVLAEGGDGHLAARCAAPAASHKIEMERGGWPSARKIVSFGLCK